MIIDFDEQLKVVWQALHGFRDDCIPEGNCDYDEQWDAICTAMANIEDELKK